MKTITSGHISFSLAIVIGCSVGCSQGTATPTPNASGGAGQSGGSPAGGGATGNGGGGNSGVTGTGGVISSGGTTGSAAATATGKNSGSGGATTTGGTTATGGNTATGGAGGKGGSVGVGGTTGSGGAGETRAATTGTGSTTKMNSTGGSGGAMGTGGATGGGGATSACSPFAVPAFASLPSIPELPDPFMFISGTRMTSTDQWPCRRDELSALIQTFEYGAYPPQPDSVTGTFSDTTLTVQVTYGGKSFTFAPTVTLPSGSGPFPVYIGLSGEGYDAPFSASIVTPMGIAHVVYNTDDIATDAAGKGGNFYTLYGTSVTAGVLMAWGWGVHRIVDALEQVPTFDAKKVVVHGFSRWGKGALVAGAFDERIALTIASSSGAGGIGSWRSADAQNNGLAPDAGGVQTLVNATDPYSSGYWFADAFKNFRNKTTTLPFDGHSIAALVAPRALLVTESEDDTWNNPIGCYTSAVAAHMVWAYLGIPDSMGFASHADGGHGFGEFTESVAFINKFILGKTANTTILENPGNFTISAGDIPWSTP